ncbi:hypothetical protein NA57DRAFT_70641 [Rhizodiscina lignyota]|uniref:Uncharacterized protein n=1 Tax=Rhizodiscina lignyota TaxID=1504668 RepID=A0A9P4IMU6_9PEZI|nr:hypothetical protein NA57DRAFT_70641 [Rhizodiscina lignyota]
MTEPMRKSPRDRSPRSRSNSPAITNENVLRSYQDRGTDFIVDDGIRRSAAVPTLKEATPYSGTIELHEDGKILHIESSFTDCGIIGTIRSVSYGTWNGRQACLLAMRYFFRFNENSRFKSTEIVITFDRSSKKAGGRAPVVRNFSPRKVYGIKSTEDKQWHYDIGIEAAIPSGPVSVTPTGSVGGESSFSRAHHLEIIGKPWSSKDQLDFNQVIWTAHETKTQKHGIPDELNLAIVVEHDGDFQAFVEAEGKTALNITLRAWPWDRKSPLLFSPKTPLGKAPLKMEFDKLSAEDWRKLAPYVGEYQDIVTMERARAMSQANMEQAKDDKSTKQSTGNLESVSEGAN